MNYTLYQLPLTGILLTASMTPTLEWDKATQEHLKVTEGKVLSSQEEMSLAATAAKVLRAIAQARGSIHKKNLAQAHHDLQQVRTLIERMKAAHPTARVKDHLWVAQKHLDFEAPEKVALDLIPIDVALTNLEYFMPVVEAKAWLVSAHQSLMNKDKVGAQHHLEAVAHALVYTEVDLPLAATEYYVGLAQELLADNKPKKANGTLADAEAGVECISLRVDAPPIIHAKKSLWQGMEAYAAGNFEAGETEIKQAGAWLTSAVQTQDEKLRAEATVLAGELRTLAGETQQKESAFETALHSLWLKTSALTEREAANAVVDWQNVRKQITTNTPLQNNTQLKVNLTDAKFYLTYAEIYEFITHDENKAQTAVLKAQMHLSAAGKLADGVLKGEIVTLEQESALIHRELMNDSQSNMSRYRKVKKDVHQLLRELSY